MEAKKLEVGDKVCMELGHRFSYKTTGYKVQEVVRLTNTQAILQDGTRLKNAPCAYSSKETWAVIGERGAYLRFTPEIEEKAKKLEYQNAIESWFNYREFTFEQKEQIYKLLNKDGQDNS